MIEDVSTRDDGRRDRLAVDQQLRRRRDVLDVDRAGTRGGQPFALVGGGPGCAFTTAVGTEVDLGGAVAVLRGDAHAHRVADVDALQHVRLVVGTADRGATAAVGVAATPLIRVRDRRRAVPGAGGRGERRACPRRYRRSVGGDWFDGTDVPAAWPDPAPPNAAPIASAATASNAAVDASLSNVFVIHRV